MSPSRPRPSTRAVPRTRTSFNPSRPSTRRKPAPASMRTTRAPPTGTVAFRGDSFRLWACAFPGMNEAATMNTPLMAMSRADGTVMTISVLTGYCRHLKPWTLLWSIRFEVRPVSVLHGLQDGGLEILLAAKSGVDHVPFAVDNDHI